MIQKIKGFILSHKIISGLFLIIIVVGVYFLVKKNVNTETKYVTSGVERGSIVVSVSGSGQITAEDTIDLKTKTSGDITYLGVKVGDSVYKGKLIASVDSRDAKIALEDAKISLDKLTNPNSLTVLQKENSFTKAYNDGWNNVSSYVTGMTSTINEIDAIYNKDGFLGSQNLNTRSIDRSRVTSAEDSYDRAKKSFTDVVKTYKSLSRSSSNEDIMKLITETYDNALLMNDAVKNTEGAFNYVVSKLDNADSNVVSSDRTSISSWISDTNNYVNNLLSSKNGINENDLSLLDNSDIKSAELVVESKQQAYNDCFLYAPFDGVIATLSLQVGEASSGSIGTLITKQKIATTTLNEVDIAKIKLGQKATLTFDAIDGLTISGKVAEIDSIGTVSQGVVTYNVKISLDVNDSRIKPGMSVSATIITDTVQDVLVVPNSAIKNQNGVSYVEVFSAQLMPSVAGTQGSTSITLPNQVEVQTGLVDDASTEIISGLKEGDIIVTKTITATSAKATTTPSILGSMGAGARTGGGGGGDMRAVRGD